MKTVVMNKEEINKMDMLLSLPMNSFSEFYDMVKSKLSLEERKYLLNIVKNRLISESNKQNSMAKRGR